MRRNVEAERAERKQVIKHQVKLIVIHQNLSEIFQYIALVYIVQGWN